MMKHVTAARVLDHIAADARVHLTRAAGDNTVISKREQRRTGNEVAVYAVAESRAAKGKGAKVTIEDGVDVVTRRALALIASTSSGPQGAGVISEKEAKSAAKLDTVIGARILAAYKVAKSENGPVYSSRTGEEIKASIEPLTQGLFVDFGSTEAAGTLKAVCFPSDAPHLTEAAFVKAVGANVHEEFGSFDSSIEDDELGNYCHAVLNAGGDDHALRQKAHPLYSHLRSLSELRFVVTDKTIDEDGAQFAAYLVGRAKDGSIVGIESSVVWT